MSQRTPLYEALRSRGGKFVDFGGWDMPLQFTGNIDEHLGVRSGVGLFDVSHMGEVRCEGRDAIAFADYLVTQNISRLQAGEACYTVMCQENGGIVDDLIVYRESDTSVFLIINATTTPTDVMHIRQQAARFDVRITDLSAAYALVAVQGPQSDALLKNAVDAAPNKRFSFVDTTLSGTSIAIRVARTGYTGERGVEIAVAPEHAVALYDQLERAGAGLGLKHCGLAARDSLRLEKKMPLYGSDIDLTTSPLEAGLDWLVKFDKPDYVGRRVLEAQKNGELRRRWSGFRMSSKMIPRHGYGVYVGGEKVSEVTSGLQSPCLKQGIGCAYLPLTSGQVPAQVEVEVRGTRYAAEIVSGPFVPAPL